MKTAKVFSAAAGLAVAAAAYGQGFSGLFAPANWTFNANGGGGSVNTAGAPASISIIGDDGPATPGGQDTDFTIMSPIAGTWSFSWNYDPTDTGTYDSAYYLLNGVETFLADNVGPGFPNPGGPNPSNGAVASIAVNAGDVIGFRVRSADGALGAGTLTISNFVIPAPGSLALLGLGGLVASRRRRR